MWARAGQGRLTGTQLGGGVTALGASRLLDVVGGTTTTTAQSVRLIVAFTKARGTLRL